MAAVTELSVTMGSLLTFESLESPTFQEKIAIGGTGDWGSIGGVRSWHACSPAFIPSIL